MKRVVFVMGMTCSGKSTVIREYAERHGDLVHVCSIGAELRKRHPPEFFRGLAAMPETEPEVREIFSQRLTAFMEDDRAETLLCDGIPRLPSQVEFIQREIATAGKSYDVRVDLEFIILKAGDTEISRRAGIRDTGANLDLTLARIESDKRLGYDTLLAVLEGQFHVDVLDTTNGIDCDTAIYSPSVYSISNDSSEECTT